MHYLQAQPITREAFMPYGWLIDASPIDGSQIDHSITGRHLINGGTSQRLDGQSELDLTADGGKPCLAVFKASARNPAGPWHELERHRLGTQTFIPLDGARYLVMVALGGDTPDPQTLAVFAASGHQAITLRAGVWHHGLLALQDSSFVVIERSALHVDYDVAHLNEPACIRLPRGFMSAVPYPGFLSTRQSAGLV